MQKKLALVTGGVRGIGFGVSLALQKAGYDVVASYFNSDKIASQMSEKYNIGVVKFDVSDYQACREHVLSIEQKYNNHISVLVNNAGIVMDSMMHKMSADQWKKVIDVNLNSCFNISSLVVSNMRKFQYGRIVNIASVNALSGQLGQTNYSASKAAIIGFTRALALESASKNITVNAVAPGYIDTEMTSTMNQDVLEKIIQNIPMRRLGKVEEIANAVLFLVSEGSNFITGHTLSVNGGQYFN